MLEGGAEPPAPAAPAPKGAKRSSGDLALLTDIGVPRGLAEDWMAVRRAKRSPLTRTVIEALQREAALAGMSVSDAVRVAVERGWVGFRASWVQREAMESPRVERAREALGRNGLATMRAAMSVFGKLDGDDDT